MPYEKCPESVSEYQPLMTQEAQRPPGVDAWTQFAEHVGGTFTEGPHSTPSINHVAVPGTVHYRFQEWEVVLDTLTVIGPNNLGPYTATRLRTPFKNKDGFRFKVYREIDSLFMASLKFLRLMKDVEIGDPDFDAQFILRGNNDEKIRRLFSNATLQQHLEALPADCVLEIADDDPNIFKQQLPRGVDYLSWRARGVITDLSVLRSMSALFHQTLTVL